MKRMDLREFSRLCTQKYRNKEAGAKSFVPIKLPKDMITGDEEKDLEQIEELLMLNAPPLEPVEQFTWSKRKAGPPNPYSFFSFIWILEDLKKASLDLSYGRNVKEQESDDEDDYDDMLEDVSDENAEIAEMKPSDESCAVEQVDERTLAVSDAVVVASVRRAIKEELDVFRSEMESSLKKLLLKSIQGSRELPVKQKKKKKKLHVKYLANH